ncbi:UNVERIFIED_CONTAM: Transcription factor [Sesamum radiatum]|uniref:Transcription factor n=1 Tax=Sesamum radiatum TaxID=300843 RepID=A0AAW2W2Z4_SESRA
MGRDGCCEKVGLKRGRWSAEEDELLKKYIEANGEGSWRSLAKNAGRTDNEIKNYWNSHLSRKIYSFRHPNPHFVPPPAAATKAKRITRRCGSGTGSSSRSAMKNNNNRKIMISTPEPRPSVPMSTTPTSEKEGCHAPESSLIEEVMAEEREAESSVLGKERESGEEMRNWGIGEAEESRGNIDWLVISSPGIPWEWDWYDGDGGIGNATWLSDTNDNQIQL